MTAAATGYARLPTATTSPLSMTDLMNALGNSTEELRSHLRNSRLTLVLVMSFAVNLVLAGFGFATALGLYTVLAYTLLLCLLSYTLSHIGIDQYELREAFARDMYPIRIRTPLLVEFIPYIGVWLAWWTITELFRAALILYRDVVLWQFFFFPALVLFVTWVRAGGRDFGNVSLVILQIATIIVVFLPTASWAPQHNDPLLTAARVSLYFFGIYFFDSARPATTHATLLSEQERATGSVDAIVRRMLRSGLGDAALENGVAHDDNNHEAKRRREQIACIMAAYHNVASEHARSYEIATLNAWILVSPLIVAILGIICTLTIFFFGTAQRPRTPDQGLPKEPLQHVPLAASPPPEYTQPPPIATSAAFYASTPLQQHSVAAVVPQSVASPHILERARVTRLAPVQTAQPAVSATPPHPPIEGGVVRGHRRSFQQVGL